MAATVITTLACIAVCTVIAMIVVPIGMAVIADGLKRMYRK
jgi:hypothetical protein